MIFFVIFLIFFLVFALLIFSCFLERFMYFYARVLHYWQGLTQEHGLRQERAIVLDKCPFQMEQ